MDDLQIIVIILAWNHIDDTIECVDSYLESDYKNLKVIIIDNGSTDNTSSILKEAYQKSIDIIKSENNLGISGGYNLGIKYAIKNNAKYIIVSNNDVIVDKSMVSEMVHQISNINNAGIIFPKIYHYYGNKNRIWTSGAKWRLFPPSVKMMGMGKLDNNNYSKVKEIEFAPSCCLLISANVFNKVGFFDTNYFFYNDDWDFCLRTRKNGFKIYFAPNAKMWHKVSISTQKSKKPNIWWYYLGKSTKLFYLKHYNLLYLMLFSLWFVIREIIKINPDRIVPFVKGMVENQYKEL